MSPLRVAPDGEPPPPARVCRFLGSVVASVTSGTARGTPAAPPISAEARTSTLIRRTRFLPVVALALAAGCSSPPRLLQWQNTGGPTAQDVTALLVDERSPSTLLAGHANGLLSFSSDQGRTWTPLTSLPSGPAVHALVPHPDLSRRIYAATSAGISVTTDGGTAWTAIAVDSAARQAGSSIIALDPFDGRQMYAGLNAHGLYRSTDAGIHWLRCTLGESAGLMGDAEILDIRISPVDPNIVYAAITRIGIAKSTDRGETWRLLTRELAASGTAPTCLLLHTRLKELLCFGTAAGDVYRSTSGGATWSPTRQGSPGEVIGSMAAGPGDPDRIFATTGSGVQVSPDFGTSWQPLSVDLPRVACTLTLSTTPQGMALFAFGQGIGLQRSVDGGVNWQGADHGLGGSTVHVVRQGRRSGELYAVVGSAVYLYRASAASWISASDGLSGGAITSLAFDPEADSILYAGTAAGVYRSTNGGRSWSLMPRTFGPYPVSYFDTHVSIRTRMFAGTPAGLFASTDRGMTWKPSRPIGDIASIRSFTYCADNAGIVHAATRDRGIIGSGDAGLTWEANRYGIRGADILAVTRDRQDNRLMYCWTAAGDGYRSTNRGMEWDQYAPPWKPGDRIVLSVSKEAPHIAFALVNGRLLFTTSSAGSFWKPLAVEELPAEAETITWSPRESALYAGTRYRGVFRLIVPPGVAPEAQ